MNHWLLLLFYLVLLVSKLFVGGLYASPEAFESAIVNIITRMKYPFLHWIGPWAIITRIDGESITSCDDAVSSEDVSNARCSAPDLLTDAH